MKQTQTHAWFPAGEVAVAYSLARRKAAAVTRGVEVAACFLARERRRRQSHDMAHARTYLGGPRRTPDREQRENTETVAKQKQPPSYHARDARPVDHVSTNY